MKKIIFTQDVKLSVKKIFQNLSKNIFSINEIWDRYIKKGNLYGFESAIEFLHLTDKEIYEKILLKNVKI
ncbi:hypothetical protein OA670_00895 [Candidatus Pelagibacter sp.]|nr:hypothetical protein [Candidatus Pelagibacter sp.]